MKNEEINILIEQLESYRLEKKLSQKKLADKLGVTFVTVNRWLNEHHKPNKMQQHQIKKLISGEIK